MWCVLDGRQLPISGSLHSCLCCAAFTIDSRTTMLHITRGTQKIAMNPRWPSALFYWRLHSDALRLGKSRTQLTRTEKVKCKTLSWRDAGGVCAKPSPMGAMPPNPSADPLQDTCCSNSKNRVACMDAQQREHPLSTRSLTKALASGPRPNVR